MVKRVQQACFQLVRLVVKGDLAQSKTIMASNDGRYATTKQANNGSGTFTAVGVVGGRKHGALLSATHVSRRATAGELCNDRALGTKKSSAGAMEAFSLTRNYAELIEDNIAINYQIQDRDNTNVQNAPRHLKEMAGVMADECGRTGESAECRDKACTQHKLRNVGKDMRTKGPSVKCACNKAEGKCVRIDTALKVCGRVQSALMCACLETKVPSTHSDTDMEVARNELSRRIGEKLDHFRGKHGACDNHDDDYEAGAGHMVTCAAQWQYIYDLAIKSLVDCFHLLMTPGHGTCTCGVRRHNSCQPAPACPVYTHTPSRAPCSTHWQHMFTPTAHTTC